MLTPAQRVPQMPGLSSEMLTLLNDYPKHDALAKKSVEVGLLTRDADVDFMMHMRQIAHFDGYKTPEKMGNVEDPTIDTLEGNYPEQRMY